MRPEQTITKQKYLQYSKAQIISKINPESYKKDNILLGRIYFRNTKSSQRSSP